MVAINREVNLLAAKAMNRTFLEIVMAPSFTADALLELQHKKNLRVIKVNTTTMQNKLEYITVDGGILVQSVDDKLSEKLQYVTNIKPNSNQLNDLYMAMRIVKHVKSNAIVIVNDGVTKGIGGGQTNRIWATEEAIARANGAGVLASDAFFPFRDCVDACAKVGIKAIIQPGGSLRDEESIAACNEHGIAMVFSKIRHFKH